MRTLVVSLTLLSIASMATVRADDAGLDFFEKRIRPLLVENCYECHAAGAKKLGGGLLLDTRDGLRKGGDSGTVIVPGKPDESLLITAVRYTDDSVKMPPQGKLSAAAIADLETWIRLGASDPRERPSASRNVESWEETLRQRARWWSLQPVNNPAVPQPTLAEWSAHPIDRFILARLEEQGLTPAHSADARTLARRLSIVLTGLPPDPADVSPFVDSWDAVAEQDTAGRDNNAYPASVENVDAQGQKRLEQYVDSLLASPQFGERWARHWLDVVRFTETHGNEWNYEVHHAWRYRDYLVRAFNADVPYDQFIREHIAGDLLAPSRWNDLGQFNESVIGTGFYRFGEVNHDDCISLRSLGFDIADNQIDTLTKAFQAMTVACARCHNHKLDAISMKDYYGLLGILRSSRMVSHCIDAPEVNAPLADRLTELKSELRKELATAWSADVQLASRYLQAATAKHSKPNDSQELAPELNRPRLEKWIAVLAAEKAEFADPFEPWRLIAKATAADASLFATEWKKLSARYLAEDRLRSESHASQFQTFADFTGSSSVPEIPDWQIGGQGLRHGRGRDGDFALHPDGDSLVRAVLPAGYYTHALSDKLNGTLRSPVIPPGKQYVSFQVLGLRSSAVRLVSNNCQLNYKNYRALTSADWHWETFSPPEDRDVLQTYAELMTMFDNPKFPDQLSALGGDMENYRLPWDKAAQNPRSFFGVTRVVLHDQPDPPKSDLSHLRPLFAEPVLTSMDDLCARYTTIIEGAVKHFAVDQTTSVDVRWLESLRQRELFSNQLSSSPRLSELGQEYRRVESQLVLPRVVAGVAESGGNIEQPIFIRGDCTRPGDTAPRGFVEVLSTASDSFSRTGSGRLELAERIASARNPLTARVMVNRIWHHLFGAGLVRTVDDFGHVGELPTHPDLLDHLATQFVADGWSVKRLIRSIVLTRTFQLSSRPSQASREIDPRNQLLQHYPARRMEAEAIRDSLLAVSGRLDPRLFGPSIQPYREKDYADRRLFTGPLDGDGRRSLYIKNNLMERPKFLETFNFPGGKVTQGRRDLTNVPAQALALLNDPFVLQQADCWATRLLERTSDSIATRIDFMFESALNRPPTPDERKRLEKVVCELAELHRVPNDEILTNELVWRDFGHTIFNLKEFIYIP